MTILKKHFLLVFFFQVTVIYCQNSESIEKIQLLYSVGGSSWGNEGVYSRIEFFEIVKLNNDNYKITNHLIINESVKNKKFIKDTIRVKSDNYPVILKDDIQNLFVEYNTNRDNYSEKFVKQYLEKPSKKEILKISKELGLEFYFKNDYSEKEIIEKRYAEIQYYKHLNEFLEKEKPNVDEFYLVMDAWNYLSVVVRSNNINTSYGSCFFQNFGQPIAIHPENKEKDIVPKQIINLNVNLILKKILPSKSKISQVVDLNVIKAKYINWFLENKFSENLFK